MAIDVVFASKYTQGGGLHAATDLIHNRRLERNAGRNDIHTELDFDPITNTEVFWQHIKTAHFAYVRPELRHMDFLTGKDRPETSGSGSKSSSPEVQEILAPTTKKTPKGVSPIPAATVANISDAEKRSRMREIYFRLAFLSSRQPNTRYSGYHCGFCMCVCVNKRHNTNLSTDWLLSN